MKGGGASIVGLLVVLSMVLVMARPSHAVTCGEVTGALAPCTQYLTQGGTPTPQCCDGVRNLRTLATTQADRRTACECIKDAASHLSIKEDAAASLPSRCNAPIGIPISSSTNCQTIP